MAISKDLVKLCGRAGGGWMGKSNFARNHPKEHPPEVSYSPSLSELMEATKRFAQKQMVSSLDDLTGLIGYELKNKVYRNKHLEPKIEKEYQTRTVCVNIPQSKLWNIDLKYLIQSKGKTYYVSSLIHPHLPGYAGGYKDERDYHESSGEVQGEVRRALKKYWNISDKAIDIHNSIYKRLEEFKPVKNIKFEKLQGGFVVPR